MPVAKHTGQTDGGNTRDVKVERVRSVTIYRWGRTFLLYFRKNGESVRRKVDGDLVVAHACRACRYKEPMSHWAWAGSHGPHSSPFAIASVLPADGWHSPTA